MQRFEVFFLTQSWVKSVSNKCLEPHFSDYLGVVRFITTQQGTSLLQDSAGYTYLKNRNIESRIYWKCGKYSKFKCPARVTTDGEFFVNVSSKHNHAPPENT